jgi:4-hydroxy-2-oxoheptanedioate aldolase
MTLLDQIVEERGVIPIIRREVGHPEADRCHPGILPGLTSLAMSGAATLRSLDQIHGFWSMTGHPAVIDAAAACEPAFICVDTQHGVDLGRLDASTFTVMASYGVPGLVRVESLDLGRIGRALDLGAAGVIVPLVDTADDAAAAVHATRHAPNGGRSYGMQTRRVGPFDEAPFVVIMVETAGAMAEVGAIAAIEGVDALYIGPADLGLALGGKPASDVEAVFDGKHPLSDVLDAAFGTVIDAAAAAGIRAGLHCGSGAGSARAVERGFRMTAVAADLSLVGAGLSAELARAHGR